MKKEICFSFFYWTLLDVILPGKLKENNLFGNLCDQPHALITLTTNVV